MAFRIYESPYPAPHYPTNLSVSQFLLQSDPDDVPAEKSIFADFENPERRITYGQLRDNAAKDAATLKQTYSLREGDVVCIYGQNSLEWISLAHAVMWAGGCFWYVSVLSLANDLAYTQMLQRYQSFGNQIRAGALLPDCNSKDSSHRWQTTRQCQTCPESTEKFSTGGHHR